MSLCNAVCRLHKHRIVSQKLVSSHRPDIPSGLQRLQQSLPCDSETVTKPVQRGCIWLNGGANICRNLSTSWTRRSTSTVGYSSVRDQNCLCVVAGRDFSRATSAM